jgi:hypothetical protein
MYDFEQGAQGWHAITQTEAGTIGFGNEWGGQWLANGSLGWGFRPTPNPQEGFNCMILSLVSALPFTLTGLQFYYDNLPTTGFLYAWAYRDNVGWHFLNSNHLSAESGSPSVTGLNLPNVTQIGLVTTGYQHPGTTDWRVRKVIITGV